MQINLVVIFSILFLSEISSQTITGKILSGTKFVPYANVFLEDINLGASADENGEYTIDDIPLGTYRIIVSAVGMLSDISSVEIRSGLNVFDFNIQPSNYKLDQVVVTGTKTFKLKSQSAVIVNVIDSRQLENVKACNLAEGLNFQPGIRVEVDCQTCNYTQLRMNGLTGGYSQILINGRPIFSPLTGLYGMEQIPINMIDRVEVVRGGGSSLYGSSAIGGVVNVITKLANKNEFSFGYDYGLINAYTTDKVVYGNTTVVSNNKNSGATFFINNRNRDWFDFNNDNFSELSLINDNTFGANFFFLPAENQKLEINMGSMHEYRYGGEMLTGAAHLALQAEERTHNIFLANIDYHLNFNDGASSLITYIAGQQTKREHYTGVRPGIDESGDMAHLANPPYGTSFNTTMQFGFQFNHKYNKLMGPNILTLGTEYFLDDVVDEISTYNYLIDQRVQSIGAFLQSDWILHEKINLISGARFEKHSLLKKIIISPRISFLYQIENNTQFRVSYSTGFRAPQSFDTDLHIAFAGGGVSMVTLAEDLKEERSKSVSASINYTSSESNYLYGFTFESFYTILDDAFYQERISENQFGDIYLKRNGDGATVKGLTIESRLGYNQKLQFESGITLQQSLYNDSISHSDILPAKRDFLRTPQKYGYATINYKPIRKFNVSINLVHTGKMKLIHLAGSDNQLIDEYKTSEVFNVIGLKATYIQRIKRIGIGIEYSFGVKNLLNSYQNDFDIGKNRDSNFVYGPAFPRLFYFGFLFKSLT